MAWNTAPWLGGKDCVTPPYSDIQAVTEYRGTFEQGTLASFILRTTEIDGTPFDPDLIIYQIRQNSDPYQTVIFSGCPDKVNTGLYAFDITIPFDQYPGKYTIDWQYDYDNATYNVYQSFVVATNCGPTAFYSGKVLLMRQSLDIMISSAQRVPVYNTQPKPTRDNQTYYWTKGLWNQTTGITIFRNKNVMTSGYTINFWKGSVTFDNPNSPHDVIEASYNFRWFSDEQLDRFIQNGLQKLNTYAPHTSYTLNSLPDKYVVDVIYGAAIDALRSLLLSVNFEEPIQFFGGPDEAKGRFGQLENLKKNYEDDLNKLLEQKKLGPYVGLTKQIVVPEYTLPGGRSRWFRYLFSGSAGAG